MKIEVGMKCKQVKVIEEYGFDYVGQEFVVEKVTNNVILCKCYSKGVGFGIEPEKFGEYFELVVEKVKKEIKEEKRNEVYTYEALPYKLNWKVTNKTKVTFKTVDGEDFSFKLIANDNATIVILNDGSKGVSRCMPTDKYDFDKGFDIAYYRAIVKSYEKKIKELVKIKE